MLRLWIIHIVNVVGLLCFSAGLIIVAFWSPAGKGLTSWLSFVISNCEFGTFLSVSWVRCGTILHRFLIFAVFLTFRTENCPRLCFITDFCPKTLSWNKALVSYRTIKQCFSFFYNFKLMTTMWFLVLCSVMFQKHLVETDTRVLCLSWDKMALKGNF